jgi:hypothetical protein
MILANNADTLTWDEFIDALDNDKQLVNDLSKIVSDYQKKESVFDNGDNGSQKKS